MMRSKKSLYNTLKINSLFHIEETTKEKRLFLFMAPLDSDGNINYKAIELFTGRCRLPSVRKARTARTRAYLNNRQLFLLAVQREIEQEKAKGNKVVVSVPEWCKGLTESFTSVKVQTH
tara:strand:- start:60922 stop:61278 length:357 start_codon:yes stop_codon:yes gene_type:complete